MGKKGLTLFEIMIVVFIIGLLASIAIPNFLKAKITANDAIAQNTLKAVSTSIETFASINDTYPTNITSLTGEVPAYLAIDYCTGAYAGYSYTCTWASSGYTMVASPVDFGTSGTTTYTISTGGILTP